MFSVSGIVLVLLRPSGRLSRGASNWFIALFGTHAVTVIVSDGDGGSSTTTARVFVLTSPPIPRLSAFGVALALPRGFLPTGAGEATHRH